MHTDETKYFVEMFDNAIEEILSLSKEEFFSGSPYLKEAITSIILDLESRFLIEQKPNGYKVKLSYLTKTFEEICSRPVKKAVVNNNLLFQEGLDYALILQKVISWFDNSIALVKEYELSIEFYWYRRVTAKIIYALFKEIERIMKAAPAINEDVIKTEFAKIHQKLPYLPKTNAKA